VLVTNGESDHKPPDGQDRVRRMSRGSDASAGAGPSLEELALSVALAGVEAGLFIDASTPCRPSPGDDVLPWRALPDDVLGSGSFELHALRLRGSLEVIGATLEALRSTWPPAWFVLIDNAPLRRAKLGPSTVCAIPALAAAGYELVLSGPSGDLYSLPEHCVRAETARRAAACLRAYCDGATADRRRGWLLSPSQASDAQRLAKAQLAETRKLKRELDLYRRREALLRQKLKDAEARISGLLSSSSWRLTAPLRKVSAAISAMRQPRLFLTLVGRNLSLRPDSAAFAPKEPAADRAPASIHAMHEVLLDRLRTEITAQRQARSLTTSSIDG
jgi:hypothetical protein